MRILFVVKRRHDYCHDYGHDHGDSGPECLGGLFNSAAFVAEMLNRQPGTVASLVQVTDNNDIDREVAKFKPNVVVIEALWVVPEKFEILTSLHPGVRWVVRLHSEIPFLAMEGVAIDWVSQYVEIPKVSVATNSQRAADNLRGIIRAKAGTFFASRVEYLPNWYPSGHTRPQRPDPLHLNIGCFGAIRPLKNQLIQAVAALQFAEDRDDILHFHVNGTRCEQRGESILSNMRALFTGTKHKLVEHEWEPHSKFLQTMAGIDVSMSVSFSETFNIISADAATSNIPLVVSSQIAWASRLCFADTADVSDIVDSLNKVTSKPLQWLLVKDNLRRLRAFDRESVATWLRFLKNG